MRDAMGPQHRGGRAKASTNARHICRKSMRLSPTAAPVWHIDPQVGAVVSLETRTPDAYTRAARMRPRHPAKRSTGPTAVPEIVVREKATAERLLHGHPWLWRDAVAKGYPQAAPGDEVQVLAPDGQPIGRGVIDPTSPILVRLWTRDRVPLDKALLYERIQSAVALRGRLFDDQATTAYRLLHGEGDLMPGFVVDRYGPIAVLRSDGDAAGARVPATAHALWEALVSRGVSTLVHRVGARGETPRLEVLHGEAPPDRVVVREHGVPFVVDLAHGQKSGAFLDQRENRRRVGKMAAGKRVLNLFSYAGGFSLFAVLGPHVTSVDMAAGAHATAQASFREAGVDPHGHAFVTAEVRAFLGRARERGERWDLIVSDPPSFAPSERAVTGALGAYRDLHEACAAVLAPGGILCAASCSSHVDARAFLTTLDDAALRRPGMRVLGLYGAGPDHPSRAAFPEGQYLKFVVLT